jgi:uncharacterized protein YndB with AHSA1/START domain
MAVQTPNGPMQMWFTGEYREVVEPERLVYSESVCDDNGNVMSATEREGRGEPRLRTWRMTRGSTRG